MVTYPNIFKKQKLFLPINVLYALLIRSSDFDEIRYSGRLDGEEDAWAMRSVAKKGK